LIEVRNKRSSKDESLQKLLIPKLGGRGTSNERTQGMNLVEIFVINHLTYDDWRKPIASYLENPDGITCRKIKYKGLSYVIMGDELFKKDFRGGFNQMPWGN